MPEFKEFKFRVSDPQRREILGLLLNELRGLKGKTYHADRSERWISLLELADKFGDPAPHRKAGIYAWDAGSWRLELDKQIGILSKILKTAPIKQETKEAE